MLFIINLLSDTGNWWFLYPLSGWGLGYLIHGITTFAYGNFGKRIGSNIKEKLDKIIHGKVARAT